MEIELIKQNRKLSFDQARKLDVINEAMPSGKFKSKTAGPESLSDLEEGDDFEFSTYADEKSEKKDV